MHSPLSTQELAHLREVSGPLPVRTMSSTPAMTSRGPASAMPAAPVIGQASKHLPHLVQASSIVSTRELKAVSKAPVMAALYVVVRSKQRVHDTAGAIAMANQAGARPAAAAADL